MRTRLWQGALALVVLLGTFAVANFFIPRDRAVTGQMLGHDFLAFYTAGTLARTGEVGQLYRLDASKAFQQRVAREHQLELRDRAFAPFWNPPFYAWLFAPLSALSFPAALKIWLVANLVALVGAIVLLCRMLPATRDWRTRALVPLLIIVSMPFIQAISHGQNTFISLLLLAGVVTAWRGQHDVLAGLLCGMLFYKPQLAAAVALMLVVSRGMRVCLGLGFVLGMLCLITAFTMPNAIGDYLQRLPQNLHFMQLQNEYLWERHVTLKAMWRLLMQGRGPGEMWALVQALTILGCAGVAAGLIVAILRDRRAPADDIFTGETAFIRRDRLIAATIAAMPLIMPFYFDYDLLLLSIPAVLYAGELMLRAPGRPLDRFDRVLVGAWMGLYLWMMINPLVGRMSGINVTVILLATVASLLMRRACHTIETQQFSRRNGLEVVRVTARRAA